MVFIATSSGRLPPPEAVGRFASCIYSCSVVRGKLGSNVGEGLEGHRPVVLGEAIHSCGGNKGQYTISRAEFHVSACTLLRGACVSSAVSDCGWNRHRGGIYRLVVVRRQNVHLQGGCFTHEKADGSVSVERFILHTL